MFVVESRASRHLLVRLPRGADLFSALRRLSLEREVRAAWIQGLGAFEWAELAEYDQRALCYRPARRVERPLELLQLEGNVSLKDEEPFVHLHAVVSHETPEGIRVLGGHLTAARVFACELRLTVFDEARLVRLPDAATGLALWSPQEPSSGDAIAESEGADPWAEVARVAAAQAEPSSRASDGGTDWARVASVSEGRARLEEVRQPVEPDAPSRKGKGASGRSARRAASRRAALREARTPAPVPEPVHRPRRESLDLDEPYPEPGDWLDHFRFGRCRVVADDPEGGVQVLLPSGVRRTIRIDLLDVSLVEEGSERLFAVRRKR